MHMMSLQSPAKPTKKEMEKYVNYLLRDSSLCEGSIYQSGSEYAIASALRANNIGALYRAKIFSHEGETDFLLKGYDGKRLISLEIHPLEYQIRVGAYGKIRADLKKQMRRKKDHPELSFIYVSDLEPRDIKKIFRIETALFSDRFWHVENAARDIDLVQKKVKSFAAESNVRILGGSLADQREFKKDVQEVLEIEKRVMLKSLKER